MITQSLILLIGLACQSESPDPIDKTLVLTAPKHVAIQAGDFEKMSFQCCDSENGNQLLKNYLTLTRAMADDDDQGTLKAVKSMVPLTKDRLFIDEPLLRDLLSAIPKWQQQNRKAIQQDFSNASTAMINYAKKHKSKEGTTVIIGFCPMAPGRWLQSEPVISNPYYGSAMLTCGVFEE